jgi:hypothetical protein
MYILSAKSVENLGAFAFKTDQSIDNTFSQINLAVQSLYETNSNLSLNTSEGLKI